MSVQYRARGTCDYGFQPGKPFIGYDIIAIQLWAIVFGDEIKDKEYDSQDDVNDNVRN